MKNGFIESLSLSAFAYGALQLFLKTGFYSSKFVIQNFDLPAGVNDYFATVLANSTNTAQQTFNNIQLVVSKLYGQGARK